MAFNFYPLSLKGAFIIENFFMCDNRGRFAKVFEKGIYEQGGVCLTVQETLVTNSSKNVIRGMHFQRKNPQAKLVSVANGRVFDVMVDLRIGSETFGQWAGYELSAENGRALYIPRGFAHGYVALEDNTVVVYQCDGAYDKQSDGGIRFDDPEIGIEWPIDLNLAIRSEKDMQLGGLQEYLKAPMELGE